MYICSCNALNEKKVLEALEAGHIHWLSIHYYFNVKPQCGKCQEEIDKMIEENIGNK